MAATLVFEKARLIALAGATAIQWAWLMELELELLLATVLGRASAPGLDVVLVAEKLVEGRIYLVPMAPVSGPRWAR